MARASIKIGASMSEYQAAMRQAAADMKNLSSEYSLAAANAKLYGTQSDVLRAKVSELTQKMDVQRQTITNNETQTENLRKNLEKVKDEHGKLQDNVTSLKEAYDASCEATGKDSEKSRELKEELEKAEAQLAQNEKQTGKLETAITRQEAATAKSRAELAQMEVQLRDTNAELEQQKYDEYAEKMEEYQTATKQTEAEMEKLTSEYSLAAANAKLYGTQSDALRAKASELTQKMDLQRQSVENNTAKTETLKEKLQKTESQHETLKQKVATLKDAYDESCTATGKNSEESQRLKMELGKTEEQLKANAKETRDLKTAITEQETATTNSKVKLAEFETQLREVNAELARQKFDEYAEKAGKVGEAVTGIGMKMSTVTTAIAGVATAAVKTTADFEAQMSKVGAISGATSEDVEKLGEKAREMGAKTKFSATESGAAMEYMAMAGWKTNDMLNGIEGIMNLAAASGEDLATTSDIVTDAMTAFGLSASGTTTVIKDGFSKEVANATHFADVLAQASSNSNTNVSMLGESFKYAAPVAGALGYSVEDTAIALGLMANSGIKASAGGTALRTMLTNLAKPTDTIADAMDYLGISLQNSDGSMKSLMDIMTDLRGSFGQCKMPMDEFQASLADIEARYASGELTEKKYNDAVADLTEKAYGAEGALKAKYAATLAGKEGMSGLLAIVSAAPEDFEKLTNSIYDSDGAAENMSNVMQDNLSGQLTILKSQIDEVAIQIGTILMPTIKSIVSTIQEWVQKFSDLDEGTKKTIVQVGAVVAAIGPLLLVVGKLITFSASVSTGLGTLSAAFAKAGIGAASAGTSTGAFSTILAAIASPVGIAVAAVAALVAGLGYVAVTNEDVRNSLLNVWKTFKANLQPAIEYISGTVLPDLKAAWDSLLQMLKPLQEFVMNALTSAWNDILIPVLEWLAGTVLPQLLDTFKNLWENVLRPLAEFIGSILQPAFEGISEVLTTLWNNVLVPLAKFITGTLMTAWNEIYNILKKKVIPNINSVLTLF